MQEVLTEQLLRDCVKEAREKEQFGLFLWADWKVYDDLDSNMMPGTEQYDLALAQIEQGETAIIDIVMGGLYGVGIIAASVDKLNSSDEYFREYLEEVQKRQMKGPVVFVPANELSEHC